MTQPTTAPTAAPVVGRPQAAPQGTASTGPSIQRQFVNFAFFQLDPAFRRLSTEEKAAAREEFLAIFASPRKGLMCLTYSTAGLKAGCDFMLWRISGSPDDFQDQTQA